MDDAQATPPSSKPVFGPPRPRSRIVLLALENRGLGCGIDGTLLGTLKVRADVNEIYTGEAARSMLTAADKPHVVLATDAALTKSEHSELKDLAARYVQGGGTMVFMGNFPSFAPPLKLKPLFAAFGLTWERGEYYRTTHSLNSHVRGVSMNGLPQSYSQKALHLKNVTRNAAIYVPTEESRVEIFGAAMEQVSDLSETPAAFTVSGRGKVGYLGDVNAEEETGSVVLAMCGLNS